MSTSRDTQEEAGRLSPTRPSRSCGSTFSLVSPIAVLAAARIAASATSRFASATAATASRRAALAVAVAAVHRTVGRWLKRKFVDLFSTVGALQVEVPHVDHPTFSKSHSISFCGLGRSSIDCLRRSPRRPTVPQIGLKWKYPSRSTPAIQPAPTARRPLVMKSSAECSCDGSTASWPAELVLCHRNSPP